MPRLKRTREEAGLDAEPQSELDARPEQNDILTTLRNAWEFASLMQYIFMFGHVMKIDDDFDVEVCLGFDLLRSTMETLRNVLRAEF